MPAVAISLLPSTIRFVDPVQSILVMESDVRPFVGAVVSPFTTTGGMCHGTGAIYE